jgi:hypothetical protein
VVGELDELLPRDEDFGPELGEVADADVAAAAVPAIADLLSRHSEQEAELARLRADNEKLTAALEEAHEGSHPIQGGVDAILGGIKRRRPGRG